MLIFSFYTYIAIYQLFKTMQAQFIYSMNRLILRFQIYKLFRSPHNTFKNLRNCMPHKTRKRGKAFYELIFINKRIKISKHNRLKIESFYQIYNEL